MSNRGKAIATASSTIRQRGLSTLPLGKSRGKRISAGITNGIQTQLAIQAFSSIPNDPSPSARSES